MTEARDKLHGAVDAALDMLESLDRTVNEVVTKLAQAESDLREIEQDVAGHETQVQGLISTQATHTQGIADLAKMQGEQNTLNANLIDRLNRHDGRLDDLESATPAPTPEPQPEGVEMSTVGIHLRFNRPALDKIDDALLETADRFTVDPAALDEFGVEKFGLKDYSSIECNLVLHGGKGRYYQAIELPTTQDMLRGDDGEPTLLTSYESTCEGVDDLRNPKVVDDKIAAAIALGQRTGMRRIDIDNFRMWELGRTFSNLPSNWSAKDGDLWREGQRNFLRGIRPHFDHIQINPSVIYGDSIGYINALFDAGLIDAVIEEHFNPNASGAVIKRMFDARAQINGPVYFYVDAPSLEHMDQTTNGLSNWARFWNMAALIAEERDMFFVNFDPPDQREKLVASLPTQRKWIEAVRALGWRVDRGISSQGVGALFGNGREIDFNFTTGQFSGDIVTAEG